MADSKKPDEPVDPLAAPSELDKKKDLPDAPGEAPKKGHTVRVSVIGKPTHEFKGKVYDRAGKHLKVSDLGWNKNDWKAAQDDPHMVIEQYDNKGKPVRPGTQDTE